MTSAVVVGVYVNRRDWTFPCAVSSIGDFSRFTAAIQVLSQCKLQFMSRRWKGIALAIHHQSIILKRNTVSLPGATSKVKANTG